jgi:hypothetical protein
MEEVPETVHGHGAVKLVVTFIVVVVVVVSSI